MRTCWLSCRLFHAPTAASPGVATVVHLMPSTETSIRNWSAAPGADHIHSMRASGTASPRSALSHAQVGGDAVDHLSDELRAGVAVAGV